MDFASIASAKLIGYGCDTSGALLHATVEGIDGKRVMMWRAGHEWHVSPDDPPSCQKQVAECFTKSPPEPGGG